MIRKVRGMLDDGFLVGLVFALFLAGKIVPFLVLVGVVPIIVFWANCPVLWLTTSHRSFPFSLGTA